MERQIELGRAVLASSLHNLELWLTTLITLSPFQDSIDIQHFSNGTLLELLTAGDVWVSRGRGLYMDIAMTLRGEPLPQKHLRQLAESMLHAPVCRLIRQ